jgi:hypothetical protein
VHVVTGRTWVGFGGSSTSVVLADDGGRTEVAADAVVLALGGASWPRLGSDGAWVPLLREIGVDVATIRAHNMGVLTNWSQQMSRHAGEPLKRIALSFGGVTHRGEALVTRAGLEGGVFYAVSGAIRDALIVASAHAGTPRPVLTIDLRPDFDDGVLAARLAKVDRKSSLSNAVRKAAQLSPVATTLLREGHGVALPRDAAALSAAIKAVPIEPIGVAGLDRAISSSGGVMRTSVDDRLMLKVRPGVFVCGEMLDWDAPTGGYLLQATFATAAVASEGADRWLADNMARSSA